MPGYAVTILVNGQDENIVRSSVKNALDMQGDLSNVEIEEIEEIAE